MTFADLALFRRYFLGWAAAILLIAALFRLVVLLDVPPGLAQDEVLNADVAHFIQQGEHAFFFREGYGHEPLYHYWSVPFQKLFGDNMLAARLPAVYLGMVLVALVLRWVKREWGALAAVVAGLGVAVSWWPVIFSRIGLRPILEPVLLVLAAWFWKRPFLAGIFLGLSFYSYTGARIVFLLPIGFALLVRLSGQKQIGTWLWWRWLLAVLAVFAVVAAPMQVTLWRDPSLQQRVDQLDGPLTALMQGDVQPVLETAAATLGVFSFTGDPRWTYTLPNRPLFDWGTAVLVYLGLAVALWRWRDERSALLLTWLAVTFIPSAVTPQAPSTVRLIGAVPVVYLLPGLGIAWLVGLNHRHLAKKWLVALVVGLVLFVTGWQSYRTVRDGFVAWPSALETRLKYQTVFREMGAYVLENPADGVVMADGFFEPIDADSLRRMVSLPVSVRWVQTGAGLAGAVLFPAGGENGRLLVPEYAPVPADLLRITGIGERPLFRSNDVPSFAVYALPPKPPQLAHSADVAFAGGLTLAGYEWLPLQREDSIRLFTLWRVNGPLPDDLSIFVHLVDESGAIVSQHDGLDAAVSTLQSGDWVVQKHVLPVTAVSPGTYQLRLGQYQRSTGARLLTQPDNQEAVTIPQPIRIDGK
jgi:hypothetical protein